MQRLKTIAGIFLFWGFPLMLPLLIPFIGEAWMIVVGTVWMVGLALAVYISNRMDCRGMSKADRKSYMKTMYM